MNPYQGLTLLHSFYDPFKIALCKHMSAKDITAWSDYINGGAPGLKEYLMSGRGAKSINNLIEDLRDYLLNK